MRFLMPPLRHLVGGGGPATCRGEPHAHPRRFAAARMSETPRKSNVRRRVSNPRPHGGRCTGNQLHQPTVRVGELGEVSDFGGKCGELVVVKVEHIVPDQNTQETFGLSVQ